MLTDTEQEICNLIAKLLDYPDDSLTEQAQNCLERLETCFMAQAKIAEPFVAFCQGHRPEFIQEVYTQTFDMDPSTTLYIGHYLFGESTKRSTFMMRLKEEYQATDAFFIGTELPDNLAVLLRFLSITQNKGFAVPLIRDGIMPAVEQLAKNLKKGNNPYASLMNSLKGVLSRMECKAGSGSANV